MYTKSANKCVVVVVVVVVVVGVGVVVCEKENGSLSTLDPLTKFSGSAHDAYSAK